MNFRSLFQFWLVLVAFDVSLFLLDDPFSGISKSDREFSPPKLICGSSFKKVPENRNVPVLQAQSGCAIGVSPVKVIASSKIHFLVPFSEQKVAHVEVEFLQQAHRNLLARGPPVFS